MPHMAFDQFNYFFLALRFAVAEVEPHGNGQAKLCRHDLPVVIGQLFLFDQ